MTNNGKIAFLNLVSVHEELEKELIPVFQKALRTAGFIGGPMVEEFEESFAAFCETRFAIGVNSGTDALRFALMAAGVREGESVVTVPNTFIATTEAISQAGARPEFVDIDERTYNMDPEKLRSFLGHQCSRDRADRLISRRTGRPVTALVPVHLYGQSAEMDAIQELAVRYNLIVIEDACQAHGAEYFSKCDRRWKKAGSVGKAAAFSFYPGKNLGACGEAGIVTTNDEEMARNIRMIRDHGQAKKYYHDMEGYNGRLDSVQAGILSVKLKYLPSWNQSRCERHLSSLRHSSGGPGSGADRARQGRYWHRDSLSDSPASAEGVHQPWVSARRFSCVRESCGTNPVSPHVPWPFRTRAGAGRRGCNSKRTTHRGRTSRNGVSLIYLAGHAGDRSR